MIFIGLRRDLAIVVIVGERVGQVLRRLVLIEVLSVGEEIEDENFHVRGFLISAAELMVACKFRAYSTAPATGMSGPVRMYSLALVSEMRGALSIAVVSLSTWEAS